ncbi:M28 family peptidase [Fulvivirga lutimaris]|uniref:M28 family peptidase n=1 Tax=Fulvivirga lutimaris TaxID=1819566 RepID=UPI0012BBFC69|nr:M28 family peptidase [Fulvivirga lutimaris]MTI41723.1 M28 family peptidase [Fulvivirga lutimaris]
MTLKPIFTCIIYTLLIFATITLSIAQNVPLNQEALVNHLDQELSGEVPKRNLEYISRLHRMRGSDDYNEAIAFISGKLKDYNLEEIELIKIPTDGKTMYGTQKARPAWNVEFAQLWELEEKDGAWVKAIKIADWESIPMVVAQDSESGEASAELVDIGSGRSESDYENKEVKGKLVLTSSQPESVVPLAIEKYGAAGIISYAQNQVTAWWKEDENLIRWGHLDTFSETKTFAFMVSLKQARFFQERLAKGEKIRLHAKVVAAKTNGSYEILSAAIIGADANLGKEEIVYTCHLDHPRPGANDNASGCVAILEVARTLKRLIDDGLVARPKRTLRFIWSPEIEGTTALLNYRPEFATNTKFNIHMDMVGGGPETKAIFHVSRSPQSLPSFIRNIGAAFGEFLNESSDNYASGAPTQYPVVSSEGGKEPLHAVIGKFHMGSDFEVFTEGSYRIPSIYLHDWPDRYIHTNYDLPGNIDPTKLKRAAFIGAASGYYIANFGSADVESLIELIKKQVLQRTAQLMEYIRPLSKEEQENAKYYHWLYERDAFTSIKPYASINKIQEEQFISYLEGLKKTIGVGNRFESANKKSKIVYKRNDQLKGMMSVFGYSYFDDHYDKSKPMPQLMSYSGILGSGSDYTYEALNLVNGTNEVMDIRNVLSAEFGPVSLELVIEYLEALESIGVISK